MKIYFAASIRGGRKHAETYKEVIKTLSDQHTVLSEHVADQTLDREGNDNDPQEIYNQDITWLKQADIVIADVTQPSLGVGYQIRTAEQLEKPVLCLCKEEHKDELSAMIRGSPIPVTYYSSSDHAVKQSESFISNYD